MGACPPGSALCILRKGMFTSLRSGCLAFPLNSEGTNQLDFGVRQIRAGISALLPCCVTLTKSLNLSELEFQL